MAERYNTLTVNRTVAAGATDTFVAALSSSYCNIVKIKLSPSLAGAPTEFSIYKDLTYAAADLVYATKEFTGHLIDPVEDDGVLPVERTEGFICAYEDARTSGAIYLMIKNNHSQNVTYALTITYDPNITSSVLVSGVPENLEVVGYSRGTTQTAVVIPQTNSATVDVAELRAKFIPAGDPVLETYDLRTPSEGGSFVHDGTDNLIITGIPADRNGCQYSWSDNRTGTWFIAWRVHNTIGWSLWSDGNTVPIDVRYHYATDPNELVDTGPPADWGVTLEASNISNRYTARASRPITNGNLINYFAVQLMDADVATWKTLLQGSDADHMKLDGRATSYDLNANKRGFTDPSSSGWGTAAIGDLVLVDVRGGQWDEAHCQWATVYYTDGNVLYLQDYVAPQVDTDLRLIIVKPPWKWSENGYLGGYAGNAFWPKWQNSIRYKYFADRDTREFVSDTVYVPSSVTNPQVRAWFGNPYSVSDNNLTHSTELLGLPTVKKWVDFSDKTWFFPIYGKPDFGVLTWNPEDGSVQIAGTGAHGTSRNLGCIWGIKTRFLVYPDLNGILKIRAKFKDVVLPASSATVHKLGFFIAPIVRGADQTYMTHLSNVIWRNNGTDANIRFDQGRVYELTDGQFFVAASTGYASVARPGGSYDLELMMGFSEAPSSSYGFQHVLSQYQINGGGWVNPSFVDDNNYQTLPISGMEFVAGVFCPTMGGSTVPTYDGWAGTLVELEVVNGIVVQNRLQGS